MGMNPDTNMIEMLEKAGDGLKEKFEGCFDVSSYNTNLVRPNGEPVPKTWTTFKMGEKVVIKDYTFKVAYIGETSILFEPVGPIVIGEDAPGVEEGER